MLEKLEAWADAGLLGVDTQVYDLTAATPFVVEIAEAAEEANAPMYQAGLVPAASALLLLENNIAIHLTREGPSHIRSVLMEVKQHNQVVTELRKISGEIQEMIKTDHGLAWLKKNAPDTLKWMNENDWMEPSQRINQLMAEGMQEIGVTCQVADPVAASEIRLASAACEFMAMPIAMVAPSTLPRHMRKRLERAGRGVSLASVTVTRSVTQGLSRAASSEQGRALHFVSGHWRLSPNSLHRQLVHGEWRIWIEGFWRGDPEHGVVLHRYIAKTRKAAA